MHVELTSRRADKQTSDSRTARLKLSLIQKQDVGCPVPLAGLFATNYTICGRNGGEGSSDGQQQPSSSQQEHHRAFSESERTRIILLYRGKIPCSTRDVARAGGDFFRARGEMEQRMTLNAPYSTDSTFRCDDVV